MSNKYPSWFRPNHPPQKPIEPQEFFKVKNLVGAEYVEDILTLTKEEIVAIDFDYLTIEDYGDYGDYEGSRLSFIKDALVPNKKYKSDLKSYNKKFEQYEFKLKEWQKIKDIWEKDKEEKESKREILLKKKEKAQLRSLMKKYPEVVSKSKK